MPILPMVLVNGAEGIGTGWSTSIPNYNPRDIVANLRRLLDGQPLEPMDPWYKGFKGSIHEVDTKTAGKSYAINGCVAQVHACSPHQPSADKPSLPGRAKPLTAAERQTAMR